MAKGWQAESDHISKSEYQCAHCGEWINSKGTPPEGSKNRTVRKVYCSYCDTAAKRHAMDAENEKLNIKNVKK